MLINKEKLINKIATEVHYDTEHPLESYAKLLMMIVEAEEDEAVSRGKWISYCKDCKYWEQVYGRNAQNYKKCICLERDTDAYFYCAYAEKKNEVNE